MQNDHTSFLVESIKKNFNLYNENIYLVLWFTPGAIEFFPEFVGILKCNLIRNSCSIGWSWNWLTQWQHKCPF